MRTFEKKFLALCLATVAGLIPAISGAVTDAYYAKQYFASLV